MDERSSLGTVSKHGCFFRNARAQNTHVEANLNHHFPAQALTSDTSVELTLDSADVADRDALQSVLSIDHSFNGKNSIKHTFALDSGAATHEFRRTLDGDAKLSVAASPGHSVEIEWDEASSKSLWTTNVRMPWGQYDRASVSFKRKFKV